MVFSSMPCRESTLLRCRIASCTMALAVASVPVLAQYPNVRVSSPSPGDTTANEVTIAINPMDPQQLAAGANIRFTYRSTDGGSTWSQNMLPNGVWGDPCVTFDARGVLYYAHLTDYRRISVPGAKFIDRLAVHRSTDGGLSWKDSAIVGYNPPKQQDKEWLAADVTDSPYRGNLYMAWTQFDSYGSALPTDSSRILFSRSTDGGTNWSIPTVISDRAGDCRDGANTVEGAVPAIGPKGEIYCSWAGPLGIVFDRSTDGGVTWGADRVVTDQPGGWDFDVSGIFRANGLPITSCDLSTSPYRGAIYICWSDQRHGVGNTDVYVITSTDGGNTWGSARRVHNDITARDQFFCWMTVDPLTGSLYVVYYDRRATIGDATEVYVSRSTNGGATFTDIKVSQNPFWPKSQIFFGDYTNIAARGDKVYPIWTRLDTTRLSIWTAPMDFGSGAVTPAPQSFVLDQNYPNPFNLTTTIGYEIPVPGDVTLAVYDMLGREVARLDRGWKEPRRYQTEFDGRKLASGMYTYQLRSGEYRAQRRMLLIK